MRAPIITADGVVQGLVSHYHHPQVPRLASRGDVSSSVHEYTILAEVAAGGKGAYLPVASPAELTHLSADALRARIATAELLLTDEKTRSVFLADCLDGRTFAPVLVEMLRWAGLLPPGYLDAAAARRAASKAAKPAPPVKPPKETPESIRARFLAGQDVTGAELATLAAKLGVALPRGFRKDVLGAVVHLDRGVITVSSVGTATQTVKYHHALPPLYHAAKAAAGG